MISCLLRFESSTGHTLVREAVEGRHSLSQVDLLFVEVVSVDPPLEGGVLRRPPNHHERVVALEWVDKALHEHVQRLRPLVDQLV